MLVQYQPFLHITLADAQIIVEERTRFFKNLQFPVLIRNSKIKSIDKAARDYLFDTNYGLKNIKAIGFIENTRVDQIIIRMIFYRHTPKIPHRSFRNEPDALAWLQHYR
uniref:DUF7793 domain-containing protein n=1 Tax=Roseihalotalea indica TaxID=2867963 RepID=A0AA49JDI1_9BACT|nr:hypothetical protein K4G66_31190 [Tunicatimonas sp. TK19036]